MLSKKIIGAFIAGLLTLTSLVGIIDSSPNIIVNAASNDTLVKEIKSGEVIDISTYSEGLVSGNPAEYHRLWKKDDKTKEYEVVTDYVKGDNIKAVGEYKLLLIARGITIEFKVIDSSGKAGNTWVNKDKDKLSKEDILIKMSSEHSTYHNELLIKNGEIVTKNVQVEWGNKDITSVTIQKNNESEQEYKKGTIIVDEGKYTIKAKYKSGKTLSKNFEIDKTPPTLISKTHNLGPVSYYNRIKDNEKYKSIMNSYNLDTVKPISVEGGSDDIAYATIENHNTSIPEPYEFGTLITEQGGYSIRVFDYAGNVAYLSVNIVNKAPTIEGIEDGSVIDLKDSPNGVKLKSEGYRSWSFCTKNNEEYPDGMMYNIFNSVGKYEYRIYNIVGEKRIKFEIIDTRK